MKILSQALTPIYYIAIYSQDTKARWLLHLPLWVWFENQLFSWY